MSEPVDMLHYVDQRYSSLQAEIDQRFAVARDINAAQQTGLNHRLDAMNEFRAMLADQAARFVSSELFSTAIEAINASREAGLGAIADRINALEDAQARADGRAQGTTRIIAGVGLVATVAALVLLFVHIRA